MTVLNRLATALNRRDEVPNVELAKFIVRTKDLNAVNELVDNLSNKDTHIQSDCIKVLYEVGMSEPFLISGYHKEFGKLLESKNNRIVWGAMTALDSIALAEPKGVYNFLPTILAVADTGSVISRDHAVGILIKLGTLKQYAAKCVPLVIEQLKACLNNQFPMYAEMAVGLATGRHKDSFQRVMASRLKSLEKESQKKRVQKVLRNL